MVIQLLCYQINKYEYQHECPASAVLLNYFLLHPPLGRRKYVADPLSAFLFILVKYFFMGSLHSISRFGLCARMLRV